MFFLKFCNSIVERRKLKMESLDFCVTRIGSRFFPHPMCLHGESPLVVTPS